MNLFKKEPSNKIVTAKTEQEIIQEIHLAFDTAQDKLLAETKSVLDSLVHIPEHDIERKASRLSALGFKSSPSVKIAVDIEIKRETERAIEISTKEQAERIMYYKTTYPFLKFLTESELDSICNKYGLIYAPVSAFIGDVPEKNIVDIENAQALLTKDKCIPFWKATKVSFWDNDSIEYKKKALEIIMNHEFPYDNISESYVKPLLDNIEGRGGEYYFNTINASLVDKTGLFIAAPQKDFDLKSLTQIGDKSWGVVRHITVNDPIVFRYVKGGIQVITKWGLEASDESLVNPINN